MMNWCIEADREVRVNALGFVQKLEGGPRGDLGDFEFFHRVDDLSWEHGHERTLTELW